MGAAPFRLLAGLGNPGREYEQTRHNVGFMILDRLAAQAGAAFAKHRPWKAELARAGATHLCKPTTFMNLSGGAIRAIGDFYKITPGEMLIVVDDMALPLGKLRLRPSGSAGGHNGLSSIIEHLGTNEFPRLRVGIGGAAPGAAVGHVLGRFSAEERPALEEALGRSVEAIRQAQEHGLAAAMNAFN